MNEGRKFEHRHLNPVSDNSEMLSQKIYNYIKDLSHQDSSGTKMLTTKPNELNLIPQRLCVGSKEQTPEGKLSSDLHVLIQVHVQQTHVHM